MKLRTKSSKLRLPYVSEARWWPLALGVLLAPGGCGPAEDADETASSAQAVRGDEEGEPNARAGAYTSFEADPVRPVAVLESSGHVAVANTPDDYLELFEPTRRGVRACGAVKVGLRPVAVAVVKESRARAELWVVNHLSDSVSVVEVDLRDCRGEVTRTLHVGDEPRDIVVANTESGAPRVFLTTAHRGQHHPVGSARLGTDLVTPPAEKTQRGFADVLVFDPASPNAPLAVVNLFSDTPRALAVGDGVVYAASFKSGNRTTAIPAETAVARGLESLAPLLARDAEGQPIEQQGELLLRPEVVGQARIEGGTPAVLGSGRCLPDPRDLSDESATLLALCVETDAANRAQRVLLQREGAIDPSCQCTSGDGTRQPATGVIVKLFEGEACGAALTTFPDGSRGCWLDRAPEPPLTPARGADRQAPPMAWNEQVRFSLPDEDVFAIDTDQLQVVRSFAGVGTVLFSLAVQPGSGKVFVTNTDANNLTRFEGHGESSSTTLIGHLHESRVTVIDPATPGAGAVRPIHLNSHIDYQSCCERDPEENARSFAFPTASVFSADGERYYFTALGSDKLGSVSAAALEGGLDQGAARASGELRDIPLGDAIERPSGPVGIELDRRRGRLYVTTHFTNELLVIDAASERIIDRARLETPEPPSITRGRSVLYNARLTSSHGDSACASCHVFGDLDGLSWDLGDPDGATVRNPGPFAIPGFDIADFRSNKGPMATQTLRGLQNHGPLHWRGDRTRRFQERAGEQPDTGSLDEASSFGEFDVAIMGLNGNDALLEPAVFQQLTDFTLQLALPPNPVRHLDDTLTPDQATARALYFGCQSMSDEQYRDRTCLGLDGALVDVDLATDDCSCAKNPLVSILRGVPVAQALATSLKEALTSGGLQGELDAIATDPAGLPEDALPALAAAREALLRSVTSLLDADTALTNVGLLPAELALALAELGDGLRPLLELSAVHATAHAERVRAAFAAAIPADTLPPGASLDTLDSFTGLLGDLSEITGVNLLVLGDEEARGTSDFRNLLGGCELDAAPACNLRVTDQLETCHGCHTLDPNGNASFGVAEPGFFGTNGEYSFEGESQVFKIPHLRNQYQKVGMFGAPPNPFFLPESVFGATSGGFFSRSTAFTGPQVRGFGFFHDGGVDTLHRFHGALAFGRDEEQNPGGFEVFLPALERRAACVARFRQAPRDVFELADPELRPFLDLCVASGPLPESCFVDPNADDCRLALEAAAVERGQPFLSEVFARGLLPLCFQLGSTLEGGSEDGDCYPEGFRERAQMEAFMLAFDTNLKPMVGQQITVSSGGYSEPLLTSMLAAAERGDCDLALHQGELGYVLRRANPGAPERSLIETSRGNVLPLARLPRAGAVTFTCHPPAPDAAEARRSAFGRRSRR